MSLMIEPKVTMWQVLKVPSGPATIGSMTDDQELQAFSSRLNEVCDQMNVPPKGQARQTTLANIFGVSQKGARKWLEAEGYCSIAMGKRIAAWGGVSFDWLMTGAGEKRPAGHSLSNDQKTILQAFELFGPELKKYWLDAARAKVAEHEAAKTKAA